MNKQLELAVKYVSENKFEEAVLAYQEAIKIDKREVRAYQGLGKVYTLQGRFDQAQKIYEQGIEAVRDKDILQLKLSLAGMYVDKGDPAEAEKLYRSIIDEDKACIEAYQGLALVYEQSGDSEKALAILEQAVQTNPHDYRTYNALAGYHARNGETDKAVESIVQSLSLDLNQAEGYRILKDMYSESWPELVDKVAGIYDREIEAMIRLYALYESGQYREALDVYEQELQQNEENQKAGVLAAACMFHTGDKEKGGELIQEIAKNPVNEWIMADIAGYYLLAGEKIKALEWASKSLAANEENLEAMKIVVGATSREQEQLVNRYLTKLLIYAWQPIYITQQDMCMNSLPVPVRPGMNRLTFDYFIPQMDCEYTYQVQEGELLVGTWEKGTNGLYSKRLTEVGVRYPFFSIDYYKLTPSGIVWMGSEAGQEASERYDSVPVGSERCMVMAFVNPNTEWTSNYSMKDELYETVIEHCTRTTKYLGVERIKVMGETMDAAHIRYVEKQTNDGPTYGKGVVETHADEWYVRGLGEVKSSITVKYEDGTMSHQTLELASVSRRAKGETAGPAGDNRLP